MTMRPAQLAIVAPAMATEILAQVDAGGGTDRELDEIASDHGLFLNEIKDLVARRAALQTPARRLPTQEHKMTDHTPRPTPPPAATSPGPDTTQALIAAAKESAQKRSRTLAERLESDITKLRGWLGEEAQAARAKKEAAAAKAAARATVDRLKRELNEAQKLLASDGPSAQEIRAWARENGVECPATGRVPKDVRGAYEARSEAE